MDFGVDICSCGHPVSKHVLAETEYARCHGSNTLCRCEGGVRVVGRSFGTVSRFFRREMRFGDGGKYLTLNRAVEKCFESGGEYVWLTDVCDSCGLDIEGAPVSYGHIGEEGLLEVEVVCGICAIERG
jgi:hypothetical protein